MMKTFYSALCLGTLLTAAMMTNASAPVPFAAGVEYDQAVAESVSFDLLNRSLKSIPLVIPGVMNPNLSPMSRSGVTLSIGQEIFFFEGKKKYLLLTVTADLKGQSLVVNELIKERVKEINGQNESTRKAKTADPDSAE